jgi:hypothetical protein
MSSESMSELKYMCTTITVHNEVDDEIKKKAFRINSEPCFTFIKENTLTSLPDTKCESYIKFQFAYVLYW